MIRIEYPGLPPKEFSPNSRCHHMVRYRVGRQVKDHVVALLLQQGCRPGEIWDRSTVRISFGLPDKRRRDLDNLIAASKPMLDALPLADDNVRQVKIEYDWFESPRNAMTIIEIEDVS